MSRQEEELQKLQYNLIEAKNNIDFLKADNAKLRARLDDKVVIAEIDRLERRKEVLNAESNGWEAKLAYRDNEIQRLMRIIDSITK